MKFTPKQGNLIFAILMVGIMTFVITGINTFVGAGHTLQIFTWLKNWGTAYVIALPIMIILSPRIRSWIQSHIQNP